jgi:hypothetical protein
MFVLISKKRILKEAADIYLKNDTSQAQSKTDFYYSAGNANALNCLCHRLGIDLTKEIQKNNSKRK